MRQQIQLYRSGDTQHNPNHNTYVSMVTCCGCHHDHDVYKHHHQTLHEVREFTLTPVVSEEVTDNIIVQKTSTEMIHLLKGMVHLPKYRMFIYIFIFYFDYF